MHTNEMLINAEVPRDANIENLIIDMRDNGGGYLESLLKIASFFLEKATVDTKNTATNKSTNFFI